jgi:hypothetical protein
LAYTASDGILLRYDPDGNREVLLQYDNPASSFDGLGHLAEDGDRNIYATGLTMGSLGYYEVALLKLNAGSVKWEGHYAGSSSGDTYAHSLAVNESGTVVIAGSANDKSSGSKLFVATFGSKTLATPASESGLPTAFSLDQNFPNPFNPTTVIGYQLSMASRVRLVVYDLLGREVKILVDERKGAGSHLVRFDAIGLASGVYFYRLTAGGSVLTRKLLLLR